MRGPPRNPHRFVVGGPFCYQLCSFPIQLGEEGEKWEKAFVCGSTGEPECLDWADWSRELTQGHNVVIGGSSCPAAIDTTPR